MIFKENELKTGVLIKLGVADDAEYPESNAGNQGHSGTFSEKPTVGQSFWLNTDTGLFRTSFIVEIIKETDNSIIFKTNNSVYQVTTNLFEDID